MLDNETISLADLIHEAINLDSFIRYLKNRYSVPEEISRRKITEVGSFDDLYDELREMGYRLPVKNKASE